MKRFPMVLILCLALGCEAFDFTADSRPKEPPPAPKKAEAPQRTPRLRPTSSAPPAAESYATCTYDTVTVPRSRMREIDQMFGYTETGGVIGPDEKVLALNGLRVARLDPRFVEPFTKVLDATRGNTRRMTYVRLPEGKAQQFDLGEALKDVSLFVWTAPDAVIGRHFNQARYALTLTLEKTSVAGGPRPDDPKAPQIFSAQYGLSWQANTGAALQRPVTIPTLDLTVELEKGQSLLIAPTGVSGRSVDRALLGGVDEATVQVSCLVITLMEVRTKPKPLEKPDAADEEPAR